MNQLTPEIEQLVKDAVAAETAKYRKVLHQTIDLLRDLAGEPEFECDVCGDDFVPVKKVVKTKRAYCSEECAHKAAGLPNPKEFEEPPFTLSAMRNCKGCGKPTTKKLYCSASCRISARKSSCVVCGNQFLWHAPGKIPLTCSEECLKKRALQKKAERLMAPKRIATHNCLQCGKEIDTGVLCSDDCRQLYEASTSLPRPAEQ